MEKRLSFLVTKLMVIFGYMQLMLLRALSGEWIASHGYKTHSCFIYEICGSSEHCKPLLAYLSILYHLSYSF